MCSDNGKKISRRNSHLNSSLCVSFSSQVFPCGPLTTAWTSGMWGSMHPCLIASWKEGSPTHTAQQDLRTDSPWPWWAWLTHGFVSESVTLGKGIEYGDWPIHMMGEFRGSMRKGKWVNNTTILLLHWLCLREYSNSFQCTIFLNPLKTLWARHDYYPHFIAKGTEAERLRNFPQIPHLVSE